MGATAEPKSAKERFQEANSYIQLANSGVGSAHDIASVAGKEHDTTDAIAGASNIVASGSGAIASGLDISDNNAELRELNARIGELEGKSSLTDEEKKELENAKGKRSELRLANVKSGTDVAGGVAGIVSSGAGFSNSKAAKKTEGISNIVGGGAGAASSVMGMVQAWKKRQRRLKKHEGNAEKTKSIKGKFWKEMAGGAMGALGGLLGAGSGIASLFGDKGKKISGFLGMGSSLLGLGGSLLDMFGGGKKDAAPEQPATTGETPTATTETPTATTETPTATTETPAATTETPAATTETPAATAETPTEQQDPRANTGGNAA